MSNPTETIITKGIVQIMFHCRNRKHFRHFFAGKAFVRVNSSSGCHPSLKSIRIDVFSDLKSISEYPPENQKTIPKHLQEKITADIEAFHEL